MRLAARLLLVSLGLFTISGCATTPRKLTVEERSLNHESFQVVWRTIRDKHFDSALGGLDWDAAYDEFSPRVSGAETMGGYRSAVGEMIGRLEQTHVGLLPRDAYVDDGVDASKSTARSKGKSTAQSKGKSTAQSEGKSVDRSGTVGIELRIIDGRAVIWRVAPESPAEMAGFVPGWQVTEVDGRSLEKRLERFLESNSSRLARGLVAVRVAEQPLRGVPGSTVVVVAEDGAGGVQTATLTRVTPDGAKFTFGHMPPEYLEFEAHVLSDEIGYIRFNTFFDPSTLMSGFRKAVRAMRSAPGIIIDIRGNPGGIGALAMGMGAMFVEERVSLGTMILRDSEFQFAVSPQPRGFRGPLAILVDECSASTSEIFAAGMRDVGRARLFGTRTAGAALPSAVTILPNRDRFQYIIANYVSAGGETLEGNGVVPDEIVELTAEALLDGVDSTLEAARTWILAQPQY